MKSKDLNMDQSEYIKQLEAQVEDLQEKYTMTSHVLNAMLEKEHKLSFFVYEFSVKQKDGEWSCWAVSFSRDSIFKSFASFKSTLEQFEKIVITSTKVIKDRRTNEWDHSTAWRIGIMKNDKEKYIVNRYETYMGESFYENFKSPVGKSASKYIKRWLKEK